MVYTCIIVLGSQAEDNMLETLMSIKFTDNEDFLGNDINVIVENAYGALFYFSIDEIDNICIDENGNVLVQAGEFVFKHYK